MMASATGIGEEEMIGAADLASMVGPAAHAGARLLGPPQVKPEPAPEEGFPRQVAASSEPNPQPSPEPASPEAQQASAAECLQMLLSAGQPAGQGRRSPAVPAVAEPAAEAKPKKRKRADGRDTAEIVARAERGSRLEDWREIEHLLLDDDYPFASRPDVCRTDWSVFREGPKRSRRGKMTDPEPRDLWTNSGGLRGATVWPAAGGPNRQPDPSAKPRVRRQYGKVNRYSTGDPLKFLEYSLVGEDLVSP